jgi:amylosucrase
MYEQISHATLNRILDELKPDIRKKELRFFYSRLGANFYAIHSLFEQLYGSRSDFYEQLKRLVEVMAKKLHSASAVLQGEGQGKGRESQLVSPSALGGYGALRELFLQRPRRSDEKS